MLGLIIQLGRFLGLDNKLGRILPHQSITPDVPKLKIFLQKSLIIMIYKTLTRVRNCNTLRKRGKIEHVEELGFYNLEKEIRVCGEKTYQKLLGQNPNMGGKSCYICQVAPIAIIAPVKTLFGTHINIILLYLCIKDCQLYLSNLADMKLSLFCQGALKILLLLFVVCLQHLVRREGEVGKGNSGNNRLGAEVLKRHNCSR